MKYLNKLFFVAALTLTASLTACSSDDDFTAGPQSPASAVAFDGDLVASVTLLPNDPAATTLTLHRSKTDLSATDVPINVEQNDSNICTIPATVHFDEGQTKASITIEFPKAEIGKSYNIIINVDPRYADIYGNNSIKRTIMRDHDWETLEGSVLNTFIQEDEITGLKIQRAKDTTSPILYRVLNPFASAYETDEELEAFTPSEIRFYVSGVEGDSTVTFDSFKAGDYNGDVVMAMSKNDPALPGNLLPKFDGIESKMLDASTIELNAYYYIPALGGDYDIFPCTITLANGKFK